MIFHFLILTKSQSFTMSYLLKFVLLTSVFSAVAVEAQDCIAGVCQNNEECCSGVCPPNLFGGSEKICEMASPGAPCKINEQCTNNKCVNGICTECGKLDADCSTDSDCCNNGTDDEYMCEANKCKKTFKEDCAVGDECISGTCTDKECTCHAIGKFCDSNDYCCSNNCQDKSCQCISSGKNCPSTGPYCCDQSIECKTPVANGIPFCGDCKSNGEQCSQNEECCQFMCNSNKYCVCAAEHYACRTDADCCNYANCLTKDNGNLRCGYIKRPNGESCDVKEQCKSGKCQDGTCQCLAYGENCLEANNQCCSGICHLVDIEQKRFNCYGL